MKLNLSNLNKLKYVAGAIAVGVACSQVSLAPHARAAVDDARDDSSTSEGRQELDKMIDFAQSTGGRMETLRLTQRMGISSTDLTSFLTAEARTGRLSGNGAKAYAELINESSDGSNPANANIAAEITGSYIKIRMSNLAGSLPFSEIDLAATKSWSSTERSNFARVLRRTAEIASTNGVATSEQAFEKALSDTGYLEKYKRGCSN